MLHRAIEAIGALVLLQAIQVPSPPRGYGTEAAEVVVDQAGVLSAEQEARINRIAFDVKRKSGGEMAIVTIPDIGQRDGSDVALEIGRQWGVGGNAAVGEATRNAGVVILVVPKESSSDGQGRCRIQTGRGTEGFILDADAGSICREAVPLFQQQQYGDALVLVATRVAEEFASEFGVALDTSLVMPRQTYQQPQYGVRTRGINPATLVMIFLVLMFVFSAMGGGRRRSRSGCGGCMPIFLPFPMGGGGHHRGGWGGGGFGGGFGGGGFGGFGGGGGFSGGGGGSNW